MQNQDGRMVRLQEQADIEVDIRGQVLLQHGGIMLQFWPRLSTHITGTREYSACRHKGPDLDRKRVEVLGESRV